LFQALHLPVAQALLGYFLALARLTLNRSATSRKNIDTACASEHSNPAWCSSEAAVCTTLWHRRRSSAV